MTPQAAPSADAAQAMALQAELEWLATALERRLAHYFRQGPDAAAEAAGPPSHPPPPLLPPPAPVAGSVYADAVHALKLDFEERLLLALATAPWLRPQLLDVLHAQNAATQRPYTEFGGAQLDPQQPGAAFQPSGQTALFLLAGDALQHRLSVMRKLLPGARLMAQGLLQLAQSAPGEPPWAGALLPSPAWLARALPGLVPASKADSKADSTARQSAPTIASTEGLPAARLATNLQWSDLVLPAATLTQLQDIELWLRHGQTLLVDWGLGRRVSPGYTALFHGPSGTGKTLSACLVGQRCGREVYRVDLSQLVSKYIGETEKNLSRLFDMAEAQGWVLFFDEAEALFGKRSAVADAHDRYANQEVAYLLQRIESFSGVCILASNLRQHIDEAFSRRFQTVVAFALPRAPERLRLWRESFPAQVTLDPGLDLQRLAQLHELSGGTIMNVVRHACLRALGRGENVVRSQDVEEGVRRELLKEGRASAG